MCLLELPIPITENLSRLEKGGAKLPVVPSDKKTQTENPDPNKNENNNQNKGKSWKVEEPI